MRAQRQVQITQPQWDFQGMYLAFVFWRITQILLYFPQMTVRDLWQKHTSEKIFTNYMKLLVKFKWNSISTCNEQWPHIRSQSFLLGFGVSRLGRHLCFHFICRKLSPQEVICLSLSSLCVVSVRTNDTPRREPSC